jgi:hypothetical protein
LETIDNIELAYLTADDYQELKSLVEAAYPNMRDLHWNRTEIEKLVM